MMGHTKGDSSLRKSSRNVLCSVMFGATMGASLLLGCGGGQQAEEAQTAVSQAAVQTAGEADGAQAELRTRVGPPLLVVTGAPEPGPARPYVLPAIDEHVLSNGLRVLMVSRPGAPTVSVQLSVDGGYTGLDGDLAQAELLVRTLRDGAGEWDGDRISALIDRNGLAYEAHVGHEGTRLSASGLSTHFDDAVRLLSTLVTAPRFDVESVTRRQAEFAVELSLAAAQPSFHVESAVRRLLYPAGHPYAVSAPSVAAVEAVDAAALPSTWAEHFGPSVARLVVVGDLPDDALAQIEAAFSTWGGGPDSVVESEAYAVSVCNEAAVVVRPSSAQTAIVWVGAGVNKQAEGWFDALLANQVLGGGASARLFMNLREDKSFTYGAYSRLQPWGAGVFRASSMVRSEVTEPAVAEFEHEFARFAEAPLASDLSDARAYLSGVFPLELQTNQQLAMRIADLLDQGVPASYLETFRASVTAPDEDAVRAAGAAMLARDGLALVLVGERDVTVPAAVAHASVVRVYDLEGALVETLEGALPSTCTPTIQ